MDKTTFFKSLIGEEVVFTIPRFRITSEKAKTGVVTGVDDAFVYIDEEPFPVESVEID